jgi:release factor glutamine methyltransferase
MNIGELLKAFLGEYQGESADLDIQLLLAHVIGRPRSWISAHLDSPLTQGQVDSATQAFARLQAGEPLPYILGHWEFYGLDFDITPDVLIPRPETELLVEKAIKWLTKHPEARSVADIGTGSGAIAVSIAKHIPDVQILATDISTQALAVAKRNAEKHGVAGRIEFAECDLLPHPAFGTPLPMGEGWGVGAFNLICANLPYIPTDTLKDLPIFGHEPTLALDGGNDGLDLVRRLLELAPNRLAPKGMMLLEIEASQGTQALSLAYDSFDEVKLQLHQDFAGHNRILEIVLP